MKPSTTLDLEHKCSYHPHQIYSRWATGGTFYQKQTQVKVSSSDLDLIKIVGYTKIRFFFRNGKQCVIMSVQKAEELLATSEIDVIYQTLTTGEIS